MTWTNLWYLLLGMWIVILLLSNHNPIATVISFLFIGLSLFFINFGGQHK